MTTEAEFEEVCRRHDLTYEYSDDGDVWRAGCRSRDNIIAMANTLGMDRAVPIWNRVCDEKIIAGRAEQFYWKLP